MKAAADMNIPTALHESNAIAGVAVKMLQDRVDRIYLNFEKTADSLRSKDKILKVGNPIRENFDVIDLDEARRETDPDGKYKHMILSYGGSMGAEKLNDAVFGLMLNYSSKHPDVLHIHATGSIEWEIAKGQFHDLGLDRFSNLQLVEYIYDMPKKMALADIIICRAGAMTVSELASSGKCAIFIPSPNVAENHQYKNAKVLYDEGAALLFEEKDLQSNPNLLPDAVEKLLLPGGARRRKSMSTRITAFAEKNCNEMIYEDILKLIKK